MSERKKKKCSNFKCSTCEYYDRKNDFCKEKEIENCSKQTKTDFSQCESYLIDERIIMF